MLCYAALQLISFSFLRVVNSTKIQSVFPISSYGQIWDKIEKKNTLFIKVHSFLKQCLYDFHLSYFRE